MRESKWCWVLRTHMSISLLLPFPVIEIERRAGWGWLRNVVHKQSPWLSSVKQRTQGHNSILCNSGQTSRAKTSLECGPWLKRDTGMELRSRLRHCGLPRWSAKVETFRQSQYG